MINLKTVQDSTNESHRNRAVWNLGPLWKSPFIQLLGSLFTRANMIIPRGEGQIGDVLGHGVDKPYVIQRLYFSDQTALSGIKICIHLSSWSFELLT